MFAAYHLHQPWDIPTTLVDGIFLIAYPSRRFQSAWMGIIVHSSASVFRIVVVLTLVLGWMSSLSPLPLRGTRTPAFP
jgi:hypothetical protein